MRSGSAFGLATQLLYKACGLSGGEPVEERRRRLMERVARHVRVEPARVAEFLGEMLGIPFDDRGRPQLRAARQDPVLLGDQMRRAFEDFVRAESEAATVVLVLEDLHWGDQASVQLVDAVLRNLRERPIMVLALARPEIQDRFPRLWAEREAREVRLAPLTTRSSTRLVREALSADVSDETVARIVERAAGNAFYLEELVRAVAAGRGDALPETIVATVQARLERLDPGARRVLRAASVFGETFWSEGAAELLASAPDVGEWLTHLADEELVVKRPVARLAAQGEYAFSHALLREGAYAMLTEEDRTLGHRLAGEWLHRSGERDAMVLAEHFERGGNLERAVRFYPRAAEQALEGNDLEGVLARVKRGLACGAAGVDLGALRATQSEAHNWRGENAEGEQCALDAMGLVQAGSALWFTAAREVMITALKLGHRERIVEVAAAARAMPPIAAAENARRMALGWAAMSLLFSGSSEEARAILDEIDAGSEHATERDARVEAVVTKARAVRAYIAREPEGIELLRCALDGFEEAGDLRNAATTRVDVGVLHLDVGAYEEAAHLFQRSLEDSERMSLLTGIPQVKINAGCALAGLERFDEAEAMLREAASALRAQGHSFMEAAAHMYLARLHLRRHAFDEAQASAGQALSLFGDLPDRAIPLACTAQALLGKGEPASALEPAQRALALVHAHGPLEEGEAFVRLTVAEVLHALGDPAAVAVIAGAEQELLARAERIADPQGRRSFLERVEENSRTLALARQWRLEP
jgi:tetratricopeptide (TPR) repeat protein